MHKTARMVDIPSICNSPCPETQRSPRQKIAHRLNDGFRLLEMWQVRCLVDEFDPRSGNSLGKLLRIGRRDDAIRVAPDDERRRADAMNAALESAVRDRPDEFAGACKRPDELCQRVDARLRISRNIEEASRGFAIGIGKQRAPAHFVAKNHPVLDRIVVSPQPDRIDQNQSADQLAA